MQELVKKTVVVTLTAIGTVALVVGAGYLGYQQYAKYKFEKANASTFRVCASYRLATATYATLWAKSFSPTNVDLNKIAPHWDQDAYMKAYADHGCLDLFPKDREKLAYEAGEKVAAYVLSNGKRLSRDNVEQYANQVAPGWRGK